MAIEIIIVGGLAAAAAFALFSTAPRAATSIVVIRRIVIGIVAVLGALFLISTGQTGAVVVGALLIFLITLAYLVDSNDTAGEVW